MPLMLGTITLTRRNEVPIHTYTSPEAGWLVNTHIIELPTQLLVVDAQYTLTFASEVVRYAETLEKPITRYRYDLSILQAEFSLTQIWDQAVSGRCFFQEVIRENIDLGRPEQVQLIFSRKMNKSTVADGRCRTRIINEGVIPSVHIYYKNTHAKQYHKAAKTRMVRPGLSQIAHPNLPPDSSNLNAAFHHLERQLTIYFADKKAA
jgi:hypothetical protein